jgi:hypothetical protein
MHRSRLSTIFIDCDPTKFERGIEFWSSALGKPALPHEDPRYSSLKGRIGGDGGPYIALQRVPSEERGMHLDIETDDIEREVARLQRLGATIKARIREHVVMQSPSGQPFCVVHVHRPDFQAHSTLWQDED